MRQRTGTAVIVVLAVGLLLAACSSGSSAPNRASSGAATSGGGLNSGSSSSAPESSEPDTSSTVAASTTTTVHSGPPTCATTALRGAMGGSNAGAGSVFTTVTLTNRGTSSCVFDGYPGVSLSVHGAQLGNPATRDSGWGPVLVTLAPGQSTAFVLHTNGSVAGTCLQPSDTVIVYPPNQRAALSIPGAVTLCGPLFETTAVGHHP